MENITPEISVTFDIASLAAVAIDEARAMDCFKDAEFLFSSAVYDESDEHFLAIRVSTKQTSVNQRRDK